MHAIPAAMARALGVNPIPVFSLLVLALAIWSAWAIRRILKRHYDGEIPFALHLIPPFVALMTLYFFLIEEYGQREHLFMLLFLPGLILHSFRWQGTGASSGVINPRWALFVGVMAGIGAAIKPHFLVIAFAPEVYWIGNSLWRRFRQADLTPASLRSPSKMGAPPLHFMERGLGGEVARALFTAEIGGFVGVGVIYAAALLLIPALRDAVFNDILPYVSSGYASYDIGVTPLSLLWRLDTVLMWIALALTLPAAIRNRPLARPLWIMTLAALLVFAWQGKGWYYHRIPALMGVGLLLLIVIFDRPRESSVGGQHAAPAPTRQWIFDPIFKVGLLLLAWFVITLGGVVQTGDRFAALNAAIMQHTQPGDPVLIIDSSVEPTYPLIVQTGRRSLGRYLTGYPIGDNAAADPDLAAYLDDLRQSISSGQPPLILINTEVPCYACAPGISVAGYLQQIGFIDQTITPDYADAGAVDQFELYTRLPK